MVLSVLDVTMRIVELGYGRRVTFVLLSSNFESPLNHVSLGSGDPSLDEQVRKISCPSLNVWLVGKPVITGELGGSAKKVRKSFQKHFLLFVCLLLLGMNVKRCLR